MHLAVYVTLVVAAVVGPAARVCVRRLAPRPAALTLVGVAVGAAVGWVWGLALLTATLVNSGLAGADGVLGFRMVRDPVPAWVGLAAALVLGACGGRVLDAAVRELRRTHTIHRAVRACRPTVGELIVAADPVPRAFAVATLMGGPGYIVVSTGMLRALDGEQRAVLLAHERSHLRNRHGWLRSAAVLACAVHPLLGSLGDELESQLERWADEDAAETVPSRQVAARSVCRAALAMLGSSPAEGMTETRSRRMRGAIPARVAALSAEAPRSRWLPAVAIVALMLMMTASTAEASHDLESLFDPGPHAAAAS